MNISPISPWRCAKGEVARIGRVWADGKPFDLAQVTCRFYPGSEDQEPDSLIIAKEGADNAPAYRGTAYVVFERMPLARFGNRLPQLSFEVLRPAGGVGRHVRAVNIIPGSTEFGYDTDDRDAERRRGRRPTPRTRMLRRGAATGRCRSTISQACAPISSGIAGRRLVRRRSALRLCALRPGVEARQGSTSRMTGGRRADARRGALMW